MFTTSNCYLSSKRLPCIICSNPDLCVTVCVRERKRERQTQADRQTDREQGWMPRGQTQPEGMSGAEGSLLGPGDQTKTECAYRGCWST